MAKLINNPVAISERAENVDVNKATWNTIVWSLPSNGSPSSLWLNAVSPSHTYSGLRFHPQPFSLLGPAPSFRLAQAILEPNPFPYKYPINLISVIILAYTSYEHGTDRVFWKLAYKIQTLGNHPKERIQVIQSCTNDHIEWSLSTATESKLLM